MSKKFFVYGTLKVGGRFAPSLDHLRKSVKTASLSGFDLFGVAAMKGWPPDYPAAVKGGGEIKGEVHEFTDDVEALGILDSIEGYDDRDPEGSLYIRSEVEVTLGTGGKETAFVYLFNRDIQDHYPRMEEWKI